MQDEVSMKKHWFLLLGILAVAAIVYGLDRLALRRQMRALERSHRVVAAERTPDTVRAAPLARAAQLSDLFARTAPPVPDATPVEPTDVADEPQAEPSADDVARATRDQMDYVDALFSAETADPRWGRESERTIESTLQTRIGASSLESVECRDSLCKVRVAHGDEQAFQRFVQQALGPPAYWYGSVSSLRDESLGNDGKIRNTMYFSREGVDIPILE
jgi:hypothetical protein